MKKIIGITLIAIAVINFVMFAMGYVPVILFWVILGALFLIVKFEFSSDPEPKSRKRKSR